MPNITTNHAIPNTNVRGYTSLLVPGHDPPQDITIFMDVSLNPGPDLTGGRLMHDRFSTSQVVGRHSHTI